MWCYLLLLGAVASTHLSLHDMPPSPYSSYSIPSIPSLSPPSPPSSRSSSISPPPSRSPSLSPTPSRTLPPSPSFSRSRSQGQRRGRSASPNLPRRNCFRTEDLEIGLTFIILKSDNKPLANLYGGLEYENVESVICRELGMAFIDQWYAHIKVNSDPDISKIKNLVANFTYKHLKVMKPEVCGLFLQFMDLLPFVPDATKSTKECREYFYSNISNVRTAVIKAIPPSWMSKEGDDLVEALARTIEPNLLNHLNKKTLIALGENPKKACKFLNPLHLLSCETPIEEWCSLECENDAYKAKPL